MRWPTGMSGTFRGELDSAKTSRFQSNREFAAGVQQVLATARIHYRHYHARNLTLEDLGFQKNRSRELTAKDF